MLKWKPLPDDPEVWNSEKKAALKYKIFYYEYTDMGDPEKNFLRSGEQFEKTSLIPGRGYKFAIGAVSEIGVGRRSSCLCIRMSESGTP